MTTLDVRRIGPTEPLGPAAGIRAVYAGAFGRPQWSEPDHEADTHLVRPRRDVARSGFTAATAFTAHGRLADAPGGLCRLLTTPAAGGPMEIHLRLGLGRNPAGEPVVLGPHHPGVPEPDRRAAPQEAVR
ncbi:hypothetical protein [Kitasatospora sp. NPDC008115]|uniref:hypothetical protein n=1 Tax=Kitasatospora sp. NPDC008115 TaxID=3364022 RepID=UPI0036E324AB